MKRQVTNVIATLGFVMLFIAFVLVVLVGALFLIPDAAVGNMVAVNERDTQIVYCDDALKTAFARGNFIIESENCAVTVQANTAGYVGESTVVVNEHATGIAFNSRRRTLIEWTTTLVDGVPYCKIKVLEPNGIVVNSEPTMVYLNLSSKTTVHNFILQNNYSNVTFRYGDDVDPDREHLQINHLVVRSASSVTIPSYDTITINDVALQGNNTKFNCGGMINGDVTVTGARGILTFNNAIKGNVLVNGDLNKIRATKTGNVVYKAANGSFTANECGQLQVTTTNAQINVDTVKSGAVMTTANGSLTVSKIMAGGLNFTANNTAKVNVSSTLVGNVIVNHTGNGSIDLQGVAGNVDIESSQINGGKINVAFGTTGVYSTKIVGYDGDITVKNIYGNVDLQVRDSGAGGAAGRANIYAYFYHLTNNDNRIVTGAYVNSPSGMGNINVYLNSGWNDFDLYVEDARSAWAFPNDSNKARQLIKGYNAMNEGSSGSRGKLTVTTPADFRIY